MGERARAYFERSFGDDFLRDRRERWCALVIDGKPFGEHLVSKAHFEEKATLAMILVSCGVDREIAALERLSERQRVHTPDFEARLVDGRAIRIEVTQFNDQDAMTYQNQWNRVFTIVQQRRAADPEIVERLRGLHVSFEFPKASPLFEIAPEVADEVLGVLRALERTNMQRWVTVPQTFAALYHCGAMYRVKESAETASAVQFVLPVGISATQGILESVPVRLAAKAAKYAGYSDGGVFPVWLAVFARDEAAGFGLSAIQELGHAAKGIIVEPFERLLIANMVAGLRVDSDRSRPAIYSSLTVPHLELPRG